MTPRDTPVDPIVTFYRHEGTDDRGRTLREIWSWDVDRLERVHDFIQWLFPLRERSAFNDSAPLVTDGTIAAFASDAALRQSLKRSFSLMMDFYGLTSIDDPDSRVRIVPSAAFGGRSRDWLTPGNHNHLRLTRILTSVRLLGLAPYSAALFERLAIVYKDRPGAISPVTYGYWQRAVADREFTRTQDGDR
jgi:hypothetical protein